MLAYLLNRHEPKSLESLPEVCEKQTSGKLSKKDLFSFHQIMRKISLPLRSSFVNEISPAKYTYSYLDEQKNFGTLPSPASAAASNPLKASGSRKKHSTPGYGSSSCHSATPSSQSATIWRCGSGRESGHLQ